MIHDCYARSHIGGGTIAISGGNIDEALEEVATNSGSLNKEQARLTKSDFTKGDSGIGIYRKETIDRLQLQVWKSAAIAIITPDVSSWPVGFKAKCMKIKIISW